MIPLYRRAHCVLLVLILLGFPRYVFARPYDVVASSARPSHAEITCSLLDQLTGDQQTGGTAPTTTGWGYDSAYRLTSRTDSTANTRGAFNTDNADQLTALITTSGGATVQNLDLTYNPNGDRVTQSESVSGSSLGYGYDQANRLTSFSSGGLLQAAYAYDGDGLRQAKTVGATTPLTTTYAWDQSSSLPLLVQAGSTSYLTGPDGPPSSRSTAVAAPATTSTTRPATSVAWSTSPAP